MEKNGASDWKIIMGLGNPGERYHNTRHNVGFMAVALLARRENFPEPTRSGECLVSKGRVQGRRVLLAWPQTYMNRSGQAAASLMRFYKAEPPDLLVIHDDMDLALGRLKACDSGGVGGHNGLASMIAEVRGPFHRLRVGIGRPDRSSPFNAGYADYVLSSFTSLESETIDEALEAAARSAYIWSFKDLAACQRQTNQKSKKLKKSERDEKVEPDASKTVPVASAAESGTPPVSPSTTLSSEESEKAAMDDLAPN
jgi:PTH1 family peptidyl-tRNA hydrolase